MSVVFTFKARKGQTIVADLCRQAEVLLIDEENFKIRQRGGDYLANGGRFTMSPARVMIPRSGEWHLVIQDHSEGEASAKLVA
jgi:hypothetical protein